MELEKIAIKQLGPDRPDINIINIITELYPEHGKKRKNGYVVAQRETLFFVSHVYYFKQVCTGEGDLWTTCVSDEKHIYCMYTGI